MTTTQLTPTELEKLHDVLDMFVTKKTSIALSSLLGEPIKHNVKVKNQHMKEIDEKNDSISDEILLCSVFLKGEGEIRIGILYTVNEEDAKKIAAKLLCQDKVECLNDLEKSSISEVGNIMSGSFFNAMSDLTGLQIELGTPGFATTSIKDLLHPHAEDFITPTDDVSSHIEIEGVNSGVKLNMFIMQNSENAKKLFTIKNSNTDSDNKTESI